MTGRQILVFGLALALAGCESPTDGPPVAPPLSMAVLGGTPIVWDANGHAYDAIGAPGGVSWVDARESAAALTINDCAGYLVSITSQAENDFIVGNLSEAVPMGQRGYWIGAWQPPGSDEPAGGWTWINGDVFEFTNWNAPAEPNNWKVDHPEGEEAAHLWDDGAGRWNDLNSQELTPGYVVEYDPVCAAAVTEILVGIAPANRGTPRPINLRSWGVVTVVVYSTSTATGDASDLDASEIDPETVRLGDDSDPDAAIALRTNGTRMMRLSDVDGDGDDDLVLQFRIRELVENGDLVPSSTELVLTGETFGAEMLRGTGAVRIVP